MPEPIKISLNTIQEDFEADYSKSDEPWGYSKSGAEQLRYAKVIAVGKKYNLKPNQLLEIGCSMGAFTKYLAGWPENALITDIAPTAVAKAKSAINTTQTKGTTFNFLACSATSYFAKPDFFDVITLLDIMESVADSYHIQEAIIDNLKSKITPKTVLLVTDYLQPARFSEYRLKYENWGFNVLAQEMLNDRLWYSCRTNLKGLAKVFPFNAILASRTVAKVLAKISSLRGHKGSKHLFLVLNYPG